MSLMAFQISSTEQDGRVRWTKIASVQFRIFWQVQIFHRFRGFGFFVALLLSCDCVPTLTAFLLALLHIMYSNDDSPISAII
jgi:hypothetical protein